LIAAPILILACADLIQLIVPRGPKPAPCALSPLIPAHLARSLSAHLAMTFCPVLDAAHLLSYPYRPNPQ